MDKYILVGHKAQQCEDWREWGQWFETADRRVAQETYNGVRISTVFLGIDHDFRGGPPLLFETMIFGGKHDQYQERYSTWEDAEDGHRVARAIAFGTEP